MAGKILLLACGLLAVCSSAQGQDCTTDTTPPVVTCSDVPLGPPFVNIFWGLIRNNGYTYVDANENFNGVSYSLPTGLSGYRYPPGDTMVTLIARDLCNNENTCDFIVTNPLTELPVNCPNLTDTVSLSPGQATYTYNQTFGPSDVTLTTGVNYLYIGDNGVMVDVNVGVSNEAPVGVNQITTVISDDVLSKTCTSTLTVEGEWQPTEELATFQTTVIMTSSVRDNNDSRQGEDGERVNDDPNQNRRDNLAAMIVPPVVVVVIILVVVIVVWRIVLTRRKCKRSAVTERPDCLECDAIKKDPEL
ncbi:uncharacterized protein [Diadema setosum]|uniref:uncharacterized protein n=1 Tax=Diadema setosum TaxID=31175 RepID=UPI003B3AE7CC